MRTATPFRAALLTADQEARPILHSLLAADPDLDLVADASPGSDAAALLRDHRPDVVLLDADGTAGDGFGVLEAVERPQRPHPIFLARSDAHAARAFEVGAVDYLLAPFLEPRLRAALDRFKHRARADRVERLNRQLSAMLGQLEGDRSPAPPRHAHFADRIAVKEQDIVRFVPVEDIIWIEAAGNYVLLHLAAKSHMLLETMIDLERRLDPTRFLRIHRSRMVNLDYVEALTQLPYGEYRLHLRSGTAITSSRSRSPELARALGL